MHAPIGLGGLRGPDHRGNGWSAAPVAPGRRRRAPNPEPPTAGSMAPAAALNSALCSAIPEGRRWSFKAATRIARNPHAPEPAATLAAVPRLGQRDAPPNRET